MHRNTGEGRTASEVWADRSVPKLNTSVLALNGFSPGFRARHSGASHCNNIPCHQVVSDSDALACSQRPTHLDGAREGACEAFRARSLLSSCHAEISHTHVVVGIYQQVTAGEVPA